MESLTENMILRPMSFGSAHPQKAPFERGSRQRRVGIVAGTPIYRKASNNKEDP